jgi:hypothetical protein
LLGQIESIQEEQIEGVVEQGRALFADFVGLQKLERRSALRIQGGNLAIDDKLLRRSDFKASSSSG